MEAGRANWFVGWPVSIDADRLASLGRPSVGELRWLDPADRHVTLAFFGPAQSDRGSAIIERMGAIAEPPRTLVLGKCRLLPGGLRFRAVTFEVVDRSGRLASLIAGHRADLCALAGAPVDPRPPLPHLTVARIKPRAPADARRQIVAWAGSLEVPAIPVRLEPLALFSSGGFGSRRYRIIADATGRRGDPAPDSTTRPIVDGSTTGADESD